ncbi:MAG: rhamnulokinase [Verrucomicrobia bacterium]|nr:rhamnulokinase [Verrucomicrobiota bacterium]
MTTHYLACDLGAESGRLILGSLEQDRLALEEIHRFPNTPVKTDGALHWNLGALLDELKTGLKKAAARRLPIASISTDSWGVDYVLYDADGAFMTPVFHYRDARTARGVARARSKVDWPAIFAETGIQFMPLNTLYQLAAEPPERLARASGLLLIGDVFNRFLCGRGAAEVSLASTTQLYNPVTRTWSTRLLEALEIPARLFPPIVPSGSRLGTLRPELAAETGLEPLEVVASCSHDTGAAVAAVPAQGRHWAYLSSGTWSLMGVERSEPILTDACRELNFTNEIGYGGTVRLLKNIIGLWLVQECRREWARQGREYDYSTLTRLAAEAPPFVSIINPTDPRFLSPDHMPAKIADFCRETGQPEPSGAGAYVRCALESLALLYRRTLRQIEQLTGESLERLHIVGGGSQNALLNQLAADALQLPVLTGPVEATAAGNIGVQALALGHLSSLAAAREVVAASFKVQTVMPQAPAGWPAMHDRFGKLVAAAGNP